MKKAVIVLTLVIRINTQQGNVEKNNLMAPINGLQS